MFDALFPSHWSDIEKLMWLKILKGGSAVWATITGNPVSFSALSAPLRQLQVAFSPVQDLNGYDSPWPAGGGKNKLDPDSLITDQSGNRKRWYADNGITLKANQAYTFSVSGTSQTITLYFIEKSSGTTLASSTTSVTYTPTEDTLVYLQAYRGEPIQDANLFQLELGSSATTYAPYSNICPISGWSSLHVYDDPYYAGLIEWNQLASIPASSASKTQNNVTFTDNRDGSYTVATTEDGASAQTGMNFSDVSFIDGHVYYINGTPAGGTGDTYFIYSSATASIQYGGRILKKVNDASVSMSIIVKSGVVISEPITFIPQICDLTEMFGAEKANEIYSMAGNVAYVRSLFPKDYYAYNAGTETLVGTVNGMDTRSIYISLGSTVYSGWVDVISGVGEVTGVGVIMPPAAINASWYSTDIAAGRDSIGFYHGAQGWASHTELPLPADEYTGEFSYCKTGWVYGRADIFTAQFLFTSGNFNRWEIRLPLSVLADTSSADNAIQSAKGYLTAHPLQAFYHIEPIPIQLTPQEVSSLLGDNVVWSTANGDLTVEYRSN